MTLAGLLNITADVLRPTKTVDAARSPVETFNAHLSSVSMKIDELAGAESVRFARESSRLTARAYVEGEPDIKADDRVSFNSRTFDVQAVRIVRRPTGVAHHTVLELEETV